MSPAVNCHYPPPRSNVHCGLLSCGQTSAAKCPVVKWDCGHRRPNHLLCSLWSKTRKLSRNMKVTMSWYSNSILMQMLFQNKFLSYLWYDSQNANEFTNLLHSSPFLHEFFSIWAVEKENKFLIGPKQTFCPSLPVEYHNKYLLKKFIDSESDIREIIRWIFSWYLEISR